MVNDNVLRTEAIKDLEHIEVFTPNETKYFKGSDVADFKVLHKSPDKLIIPEEIHILTMDGLEYRFYNVPFVIVYNNQEKL